MASSINLTNRLNKNLPAELGLFLRKAGEEAAKLGHNSYLVGGAVRDLLLGQPTIDIDIVIEGDAIELAKCLRLTKAKIIAHNNFGTANIKWNHTSIDIATARSEIYSKPGALPEVTPSNINRDLFRRDFTINAMAVSLNPDNFGELIDPYRGLPDLKDKLIRILHENSFIDDATRIWRAIRYEQRLGFKLETETLRLLKRDIEMLDTISADRIRHELELVLKEKQPEKVLYRADELNILAKMNPGLKVNDWLKDKFDEARKLGLVDSTLTTVYTILFVYGLKKDELASLLTFLRFPKAISQILKESIELRDKLPELDKPKLKPSEIYFRLNEYSELTIIANSLATDSPIIEQNIESYITRLRHIKPRINGDDLKRLGIAQGPEINKLLHLILEAKLDGKVITKQGETRLVYYWIREHGKTQGQ